MNPVKFGRPYIKGLFSSIIILLLSFSGTAQILNDDCLSPQLLISSTAITTVPGTLRNAGGSATPTAGINAFCGDAASPDAWYSFVAQTPYPSIRLTGMNTQMRLLPRLQLFNTATCNATTLNANSNTCASINANVNLSLTPATALTIGVTYFVRVFTGGTSVAAGTAAQWNFNIGIVDVPINNLCAAATTITSSTSCVNTTGNVLGATVSTTNVNAPNCGAAATYDVWYKFIAATTNPTITLSNPGADFQNSGIQLLSNSCGGTFTQLYCGTSTITANYLNPGTTYFIRVFSTSATVPAIGAASGFDLCIVDPVTTIPPANDECAAAVNLSVGSNCANVMGNMAIATPSSEVLGGTCAGPNAYDLWYKFKATGPNENITLSTIGANFLTPQIELLSGNCGSFTSVLCGTSPMLATGLTAGTTYYVRVYSTTAPPPNGNARFNICIQNPDLPAVRFGNSYVNISRKTTGGVVQPGDTLEIRMTIHHAAATTLTNARFVDNTPTHTTMLTGVNDYVKIITNEGLTYKQYSLAAADDAATYTATPAPGEYNIRMNVGFGASNPGIPVDNTVSESASATGTMLGGGSGNFPRGGSGLLFAAAYRVVVSGIVGDVITLNPAHFVYNAGAGDITLTSTSYQLLISDPLSLCSNSIGVNNAAEYGGTFGTGTTLNRPTDLTIPISGYSFVNDVSAYTPVGDGRYGLVKNMSPRNSTNKMALRAGACGSLPFDDPYSCNQRMYGHWYIDGDHTGTNDALGNLPPDEVTNSGYMLMVNADYVASEVYTQTISNLCPDTYYEFSGWFRNICPTCGVDSIGQQFTGTVTAPALGYPGVYPNLSFSLNGLDYYSTGEIDTTGWQKKGFVFRTGPAQTSATFAIRNNSQGGGGNDWVLDDISVATCTPNLNLIPVGSTNQCYGNQVNMACDVISYFNNYVNYQWQVSHDNGANFTDTLPMGTGAPTLSAGNYVYNAAFPNFLADSSQHMVQYRIRVATSATNLYSGCAFFNSARIVVMVNNCSWILKTDLLSFKASLISKQAHLKWQTENETAQTSFEIQKSLDGNQFFTIGTVNAVSNMHTYSFKDPELLNGSAYYRIIVKEPGGQKISNRELLKTSEASLGFISVTNPFYDVLSFDLNISQQTVATIVISDAHGKTVRSFKQTLVKGLNEVTVNNLGSLAGGTYILQVISGDGVKSRKLVKLSK